MKFVTIFPHCENEHLIKDVGMLPYTVQQEVQWEAAVACYKSKRKFSLLHEVNGLQIDQINKVTGRPLIDTCLYIIKNAKNIDVLQSYHLTSQQNYYWFKLYKLLNPLGITYLKLDTNYDMPKMQLSKKQKWIVENTDIISAEIKGVCSQLKTVWKRDVKYIPNGIYVENSKMVEWKEKENTILSVQRVGTYQKNTELLLKIFADTSNLLGDYRLKIIGPIEETFKDYIHVFFENHKDLIGRIEFCGNIDSRQEIENEYAKAKIFFLTSRWESYGIAYAEALHKGCYILSTEVDSINEILDNGRYGEVFGAREEENAKQMLVNICKRNSNDAEKLCKEAQLYARDKFNWNNIIRPLFKELQKNE